MKDIEALAVECGFMMSAPHADEPIVFRGNKEQLEAFAKALQGDDYRLNAASKDDLKIYEKMAKNYTSPPNTSVRLDKAIEALRRLSSMEAFTYARAIHPERDAELLAFVDYAREALKELE